MSQEPTPEEMRRLVTALARRDGRYSLEAFFFVSESLGRTVEWLREGKLVPQDRGGSREEGEDSFHVSGRELLAGFRLLARDRWGCLARHVLGRWGLFRTEDVGAIVFLMVNDPAMKWKKRECDTEDDFRAGFGFAEAFDPWSD